MLATVIVDRSVGGGRDGDVIDAAEVLGKGDYRSAANALAVMARQSELYVEAHTLIAARHLREAAESNAPAPSSPPALCGKSSDPQPAEVTDG